MTWKRIAVIVIPAFAVALFASGGAQAVNLVSNGGFEVASGSGQFDQLITVPGWSSPGDNYNFLFTPGSADTTGVTGQYGDLQLWGPNNGSPNGLPATSPDGGNYVAADGAFQTGAISQTINGLTNGDTYTVGFWWAGAQQSGFDGPNTEQFQVSFGAQTQLTPVVNNDSHGFTGWAYQTFNFVADGASDVLSFLAVGTPNGVPPFSLLDGVSVNAVPEPATLSLWCVGLFGFGAVHLRRRAKSRRNLS